ncbi:MAG: hypothetical protein GX851_05085 [Clostridiales bacterium]|nr:hypothetical protein [Clostridiales bacterium]
MSMYSRNIFLEKRFRGALSRLHKGLPEMKADNPPFADKYFPGNRNALTEPAADAKWSLGYAQAVTVPSDISDKPYCIAGNIRPPANYAKGVLNETRVRAIALDDGSGRGTNLFAVIDCIGLSNYYIRKIRWMLGDYAAEKNISTVNISSTHSHSAVDTMGIWGPLPVLRNNRRALKKGKGTMLSSIDEEYMEFLCERTAQCLRDACEDMKPGKLYEAKIGHNTKVNITKENRDSMSVEDKGIDRWVWDRRAPVDCSAQLLRLRFVPDDKSCRETMIINMAAHPYIDAMKISGKGNGDMISGDYVCHMGEYFEKSGYNFLFFNGAVAGVYPSRLYSDVLSLDSQANAVGNELGRIARAMTMTTDEIYADPLTNPDEYEKALGIFNGTRMCLYTSWIAEKGDFVACEKEVSPVANIALCEAQLSVDNPIYIAIGKLGVGKFNFTHEGGGAYKSTTEVGYLEIGENVKVAMIPGELEPSVVSGTLVMHAEHSFSGTDFTHKALSETAGGDNLYVFGLTNDAIGYIIPDNDFCMLFLGTKKAAKLFGNHYLEIFSFGKSTASTIAAAFEDAVKKLSKPD